MTNSISVLGCGWLGLPLASRFVKEGFKVNGATTQASKFDALAAQGIRPYLLNFTPNASNTADFFQSQITFVNIPFKRTLSDPQFYKDQIQCVMEEVVKAKCPWVIFASSTLVYPDNGQEVSEGSVFKPQGPRAQVLYDIERMLLNHPGFKATIIRFAGLYGPGRRLRDFHSRPSPQEAQGVSNLVHLDDCIGIVQAIIKSKAQGGIFNAVSDGHPPKNSPGKIVSNAKIKAVLQYRLYHPDPSTDMA